MHLAQKFVSTRLTKIFIAIFAPDERLPSSATLLKGTDPYYHIYNIEVVEIVN